MTYILPLNSTPPHGHRLRCHDESLPGPEEFPSISPSAGLNMIATDLCAHAAPAARPSTRRGSRAAISRHRQITNQRETGRCLGKKTTPDLITHRRQDAAGHVQHPARAGQRNVSIRPSHRFAAGSPYFSGQPSWRGYGQVRRCTRSCEPRRSCSFGTVDCFLSGELNRWGSHATGRTTPRDYLYDIRKGRGAVRSANLLDIPMEMLPRSRIALDDFGSTIPEIFWAAVPIPTGSGTSGGGSWGGVFFEPGC